MSRWGIFSTPSLRQGASRSLMPRLAWGADQRAIGLPSQISAQWPRIFLNSFGHALKRYRSFRLFLETCVHCGACAESCSFYLGTGDPLNMPMARADLAREVYRRFFKGPLAARRRRQPQQYGLTSDLVIAWYTYFYQCSLCRRCAKACPLGIDTSLITRICREVLADMGIAPQALTAAAASCRDRGNSLGISPQSWRKLNLALESSLIEETGLPIKCPVNQVGSEVLLIAPADDLQTHQGTFAGYAKVFHATGVSWTTSTLVNDASNPGLYFHTPNLAQINRSILTAARELKPRYIIWGESGHGWWVGRNYADTISGPWSRENYLDIRAPLHVCEWTCHMLSQGAFHGKINREANDDKVVTLHDPCHCARSANLLAEPRELIKACAHFFAEMPRETIGPWTLCCGGGGGIHGRRLRSLQMAGFLPRARALNQAQAAQGCNWVATLCDQCKGAIQAGLRHYRLPYRVGGVLDLFGQALYPSGRESEDS